MGRGAGRGKNGLKVGRAAQAILVVTAIAVFFLIISRGASTAGRNRTGGRPAAPNQPLQNGKPAPDFTAAAFDGSTVKLSSLRDRVVLVNFFASWCAECRSEIPDIERAYRAKHASGFDVIGVNAWENGNGQAFLRDLGGTFPAVSDPQPAPNLPGPIASRYGLDTQALPVSVFVDRKGDVHQVYPGRIDTATIADELRQMGIS